MFISFLNIFITSLGKLFFMANGFVNQSGSGTGQHCKNTPSWSLLMSIEEGPYNQNLGDSQLASLRNLRWPPQLVKLSISLFLGQFLMQYIKMEIIQICLQFIPQYILSNELFVNKEHNSFILGASPWVPPMGSVATGTPTLRVQI